MIFLTFLRFAVAVMSDARELQRTINERYPFLAE
jgi:hypothetical protein